MCIKQSVAREWLSIKTIRGGSERFIGAVQRLGAVEPFYSPAEDMHEDRGTPSLLLLGQHTSSASGSSVRIGF